MKTAILILLSIVICSSAQNLKWSLENAKLYNFSHFMNEFEKKYDNEQELQFRKNVFETTLKKIHEVNANPKMTWKAGVNEFTDRTDEEFGKQFGYNKALSFKNHKTPNFKVNKQSKRSLADVPNIVDWRDRGVVSPVRNQGRCGSCWAFATVATVESHIAIQTGHLLAFSEQQLVDCAPNNHHCGGVGGCEGSTQSLGMSYFHLVGGMVARDDYPYTAKDGECQSKIPKVASIDGFHQIRTNDYDAILEGLANRGPLAISVAATSWKIYQEGVYNAWDDCGADVNHVVVAVGYGESEEGKFWIVRNSWGESWGEKGYIRLFREKDSASVNCMINNSPADGSGCDGEITVCGICGMYMDTSYPLGGRLGGRFA